MSLKYNYYEIEKLLFQQMKNSTVSKHNIPLVSIVTSTRTGSTLLYQYLINMYDFYFISNFMNNQFADYPVVGDFIESHMVNKNQLNLKYESSYGKTSGIHEPNEASLLLKNWFESEHPSEINATKIKKEKLEHMYNTLNYIYQKYQKTIIFKNAWNSFRIKDWKEKLPNTFFIWLRRDIVDSAYSDLLARKRLGDPSKIWNSATTKDYKEIQKLPYWEQVVEQQVGYHKTIERDLKNYSCNDFVEIWYEDLLQDSSLIRSKLSQKSEFFYSIKEGFEADFKTNKKEIDGDYKKIEEYVNGKYPEYKYS